MDRNAPFTDPSTGQVRPPAGPEMRLDVLTGEWIPMASHRMNRTFLPAADSCPLCPAQPDVAYQDGEIPDSDYHVAVFENRFPSYWQAAIAAQPSGWYPETPPNQPSEWHLDGNPLWPVRPAAGRCEVICFSPQHQASMASLSDVRMRTVIEAWAHRTAALQTLGGIAQVYPFENRGPEIGVTLPHPHGQIYAYPHLAPKTEALLRQATAYRKATGRHLLSDVTAAEADGPRVVARGQHWLAYVPAAARWPVELHLAPLRAVPDLPALNQDERAELAALYPHLLRGLDRFFVDDTGQPLPLPYISGWHQAPVDPALRPLGRLHLQLFSIRRAPGKLKYLAGSESGMGVWVSDTTPELIADRLRTALSEVEQLD
jgi:UDPglucose--hexose-1-phosphate uridylyltransferase